MQTAVFEEPAAAARTLIIARRRLHIDELLFDIPLPAAVTP
jgi:hypothetical protein